MKIDNKARPEYDIYMLSLSILIIENYKESYKDENYIFN